MPLELARRVAVTEVDYRPEVCMSPHAHRVATVSLVVRGGVSEEVRGETHRSGPLSVVVKPAGVVHQDRFDARGARLLSMALPRCAGARFERYEWFHGGEVARLALGVLEEARQGDDGARARSVERLLVALTPKPPSEEPAPWVVAARDALAQGRSVEEAALRLGVHPGSLTRAFRRAYGVTPVEARARRRVADAADLLVSTTTKLAAVAAEVGFSDQAHFTNVFRRQTGRTPAAFRRLTSA